MRGVWVSTVGAVYDRAVIDRAYSRLSATSSDARSNPIFRISEQRRASGDNRIGPPAIPYRFGGSRRERVNSGYGIAGADSRRQCAPH